MCEIMTTLGTLTFLLCPIQNTSALKETIVHTSHDVLVCCRVYVQEGLLIVLLGSSLQIKTLCLEERKLFTRPFALASKEDFTCRRINVSIVGC